MDTSGEKKLLYNRHDPLCCRKMQQKLWPYLLALAAAAATILLSSCALNEEDVAPNENELTRHHVGGQLGGGGY